MALNFFRIARGISLVGQSSSPTGPANGDLYFDSTAGRLSIREDGVWKILQTANGTDGGAPGTYGAADTIDATQGSIHQCIFVESDGGAVNLTSNPQIAAGNIVGQMITVVGTSASDTLQLDDGTGLSLNGSCILDDNQAITLLWNGSVWTEISRRA